MTESKAALDGPQSGYRAISRANLDGSDPTLDIRQQWETPKALFDTLHTICGFTIDACASPHNALLPRYWTKADDCTQQAWAGERVFCNPPFNNVGNILPKAKEAELTLFLLPLTCLTTRYFGANPPTLVVVPPYRIKFVPPEGLHLRNKGTQSPTLGSVALVYGGAKLAEPLGTVGRVFEQWGASGI